MKFVTVVVNEPSAAAWIGCVESIFCAMFTLPQGAFVEGLWTSLRTGVPVTPKGGLMTACAATCRPRPRTIGRTAKNLENMVIRSMKATKGVMGAKVRPKRSSKMRKVGNG